MNQLSGTHSEVPTTSYLKVSFIHSSEIMPPPKGTPTQFQESHHVVAIPSIPTVDRDGSRRSQRQLSALISLLSHHSVTTLQLNKQFGIMMDKPPTCQSQSLRRNPGDYKNQHTQTE